MKDVGGRRGALAIPVMAPVLVALAFAVGLAYLAFGAARAQRVAARRTVTDFADFAAFIIGNAAQQEIERRLLYAFAPVRVWDPGSGAPLPEPAAMARDRAESQRCAASGLPEPTYARLDLRTGALALAGTAVPEATAHWLADTLAVAANEYGRAWSFAHILGDRAGMATVAYTLVRDDQGQAIAAYAKSSCLDLGGRSVFEIAAASTTALPPTLTGGLPNDSLLRVLVRDPRARAIYESPSTWTTTVSGLNGPRPQLGNLEIVVDIRQSAADQLVVGGVPYGGAPMAGLLLLLITVFGLLAILQVQRQQALLRARERFISNVSHELRTPLQQILVFAQLLRMEKLESQEERRHSIAVIERETRRLIQLVENVLTFARASRGEERLASNRVELEPVARETVQAFHPLAQMNRTTLEVVADSHATATGDAGAVRRVLLNLLDNAVKYGPAGQIVTVTIRRTNGFVTLTVDDQGPGIRPDDRSRVWLPFQRLESAEDAASAGSGMGLAIVRDLVARMRGDVRIEDAPGGGARFVVSLPSDGSP